MQRVRRGAVLLALMLGAASAAAAQSAGVEGVRVRWLGVAGFSIAAGDTVLLHDPYLSRPGLWGTLVRRYRPDLSVLAPLLQPEGPAPELAGADWILIGHSHFDHLGDAPWLATQTGAVVAGSATTVNISRGYGLGGEQLRQVDPGHALELGPFSIRVVESRHARVILGRVPLPGEVTEPQQGPLHALSFPLGDARGYLVEHAPSGLRLYFLSSAGVHEPALEALRDEPPVDVLFAASQGRDEHYARALVGALRPHLVVPHHFDSFFRALDHPQAAAPSDPEDLDAFEAELRGAARELGLEIEIRRPALFELLVLDPPA